MRRLVVSMTSEVGGAVGVRVSGMGGVTRAEDSLEFVVAGAAAVQVGTANFTDTLAMPKIIEGLNEWMDAHGVQNTEEICGTPVLNG